MTHKKKLKRDTVTTRTGRDSQRYAGLVNTPVFRGSTVLFPDVRSYEARDPDNFKAMRYGTHGTPTTFALEEAVAELEGGHAEFFGDADTGLEEDPADGEFLEVGLRRTDSSFHRNEGRQGSVSRIRRGVGRHKA